MTAYYNEIDQHRAHRARNSGERIYPSSNGDECMKTKHRTAARAKQRQRDTEYTQPSWLDKLADDLRKREQAHRWPVKQERMA